MSDLERQELLADMRHRTALHCGSNHHETVLMVEMIDRLRAERDAIAAQVAQMREALERFLRVFPYSEIEMARECWGNTNTHLVGEGRKSLEAVLALPPTAAEERVRAVIEAARQVAELAPPEKAAGAPRSFKWDGLRNALRAFDGKAGESDVR